MTITEHNFPDCNCPDTQFTNTQSTHQYCYQCLTDSYWRVPRGCPARVDLVTGVWAASSSVIILTRVPTARLTWPTDWNNVSTVLPGPPDIDRHQPLLSAVITNTWHDTNTSYSTR